jgi:hypothetical protein
VHLLDDEVLEIGEHMGAVAGSPHFQVWTFFRIGCSPR